MTRAKRMAQEAGEARKAWARALLALLDEGAWLGSNPKPPDRDGLIKVLGERLANQSRDVKEPVKAIGTWLNGTVPFSKAFSGLCRVLFGDNFEGHDGYAGLKSTWDAARKSAKAPLLETNA